MVSRQRWTTWSGASGYVRISNWQGGEDMDRDMGKLEDLGKFLGVSFEGFEEDFNDVLKDI